MTLLYRGISGSSPVYWDNVSTFMPPGTINITIIDEYEDSGTAQETLLTRISRSYDYVLPGGKLQNSYKFDGFNRTGRSTTTAASHMTASSAIADGSITYSYPNALNAYPTTNTNSISTIDVNGSSVINWSINPNNTSFTGNNQCFMLEFAVKFNVLTGWQGLFGNFASGTNDYFVSWKRGDTGQITGRAQFHHPLTYSTTAEITLDDPNAPSANVWYHYVYCFDNSQNNGYVTGSIYLDGNLSITGTVNIPSTYVMSASKPFYAGYNAVLSDVIYAKLGYMRTYNQPLTATEIRTLYSNSFVGIMKSGL